MDLSVQDWLIVIGALLIVGVLLDAARRYRAERRNSIRMAKPPRFGLGPGGGFADDSTDPVSTEVIGAARVRERGGDAGGDPGARVEPSLEGGAPQPAAPPESPRQRNEGRASRGPEPAAEPIQVEEELFVIHVMARDPQGFSGTLLQKIFHECDVRHGEMDIYHRHELDKGQGAVQFSVVNIVKPGSFDLATIDTLVTPGLSFFMRLPGPQKPHEAFDCMLETARVIVKNLGGEMRDASNSAITNQTLEHYRQRIRDYAHRKRVRR